MSTKAPVEKPNKFLALLQGRQRELRNYQFWHCTNLYNYS